MKKESTLTKKEIEQVKKESLDEIKNKLKDEIVNDATINIKKDIDKMVKDIRDSINVDYKLQLEEEIKKDLIEDIKTQIRKEENKLSRRKSYKIFRLNIYLLIMIAFCGFLIYQLYINDDLNFLKIEKLNKNVTTTTTEVIKHDSTWYIEKYSYLLDNVFLSSKTLLDGDNKVDKMKDSIKLNMVYKTLKSEDVSKEGSIYKIDKSKIEEAYINLFGNNDELPLKEFNVNNINFAYISETNSFIAIAPDEKEEVNILNNILDISEEDTFIKITTLVYYKIDDKIYNINTMEEVSDNSELSKINYIFKKVGKKYYLYSIENIK